MREDILETKSLAKQLMAELKALSASLNSDYIMKIGFAQALRSELSRLSGKKKFEVIFTETGKEYSLIAEHEIILFRLCQETLNNILQYAKAKTIKASLVYLPEMFTLSIADDGIGFDIDNVAKQNMMKESTGLINIKKRAKLINAEVNIQSIIGEGTSVTVQIPKQLPL